MPRIQIPFNGPAYQDISRFLSSQECVNFYIRPIPASEGRGFALIGSPGLESWVDLGTSAEIRGVLATRDQLYVVSKKSFFRIDINGNKTEIGSGTIVKDSGLVSMATNGVDVTFVDGSACYTYDIATDSLSKVNDADFLGGNIIVFIAGYYYVNKLESQEVHQSAFNDGSSWSGYFDSAGQESDNVISLIADHGELLKIGETSTEPWYNAGLQGYILSRRPGAYIEQGTIAPFSVAKANNAVYWLGQDENGDGQVFQVLGLQPSVVSTPAIDYQIAKLTKLSDAIGFTYTQNGQTFYVLTFPTDDRTFVYDTGNAQWHERSSVITIGTVTKNGRWRVNCHALFNRNHIVGDFENGKLYKLKDDVYDEDGTQLIARRRTPIIRKNQDDITINELQILVEPGVGLVSGQGDNPQIIFSWSIDGGATWGNEIHVPIGKIGEYDNRAITPPLGQGRNWVLEAKISDPIKRVIVGAFADIEVDID